MSAVLRKLVIATMFKQASYLATKVGCAVVLVPVLGRVALLRASQTRHLCTYEMNATADSLRHSIDGCGPLRTTTYEKPDDALSVCVCGINSFSKTGSS